MAKTEPNARIGAKVLHQILWFRLKTEFIGGTIQNNPLILPIGTVMRLNRRSSTERGFVASMFPREVSFATAILLGLGVFSAALAAGFMAGYWIKARESAQNAGRALFLERQSGIAARLDGLFDGPQFAAVNLADNPQLKSGKLDELEQSLLSTIEFYPWIVNIKIGIGTGLYYSVSQIAPIPDTRYYTPPAGAAYAIVVVSPNADGTFTQTTKFRDRDLALMSGGESTPSSTDVRKLDWYQIGRDRGGELAWIGRVVQGGVGARISFVMGFYGQTSGTVGIDVGERDVSTVLNDVRVGSDEYMVVFDTAGTRYGTTNSRYDQSGRTLQADSLPTSFEDKLEAALIDGYKSAGVFSGEIQEIDGAPYFMSVMPISLREGIDVALYAGIATPLERLEAPLRENLTGVLGVIALTLLVAIPFVIYTARKVSEPLTSLSALAEDTLELKFSTGIQFDSTIREVRALTASFRRAQVAFRNICRFVPEAHVRRTIATDSASVFGERRTVSLLMTDVTGFTTMAENMEPERLLGDMTEYFNSMNREILAEGGTIDKYVGDAIFSYWNGVDDQANHAMLCCHAGLRVRDASRRLAVEWRRHGKLPWATRIGLHSGDVIVGNIGSESRMDFTVIGGAVNLASRVEGLNKFYGTEILATDAIRQAAGDGFLFRPIDVIRPKGVHIPTEVYELVAVREGDGVKPTIKDLEKYCVAWNTAFGLYRTAKWNDAFEAFGRLAQQRPQDPVARLYVRRCQNLMANPPGDWDGVETFDQK